MDILRWGAPESSIDFVLSDLLCVATDILRVIVGELEKISLSLPRIVLDQEK